MLIPSIRKAAILRRTVALSLRQYHSANHPPSPTYTPLQHQILSKALTLVPSKGFTADTLTEGAKHAGYLEITHNLFPRGPWSLVEYHLVRQREALSAVPLGEGLGVGRTIRKLCVERLKGNTEIIGQWQEALALMSLPENIPDSLRELAKLADEMWFLAGDRSVDFSWYTKRGTLSAVYASTEVFMTTDKSEDFKDTFEFLDRRLGDVHSLGRLTGDVSEYVSFTAHAIKNIANSRGMWF